MCCALSGYEAPQDASISILSLLFARMRAELLENSCKLGIMYMLYEIGSQSSCWRPTHCASCRLAEETTV